ncbi:MAG: AcvB/VirJ family lysyl-phosphatidylglycerol hydrolase [Rhodanobacter sp.]
MKTWKKLMLTGLGACVVGLALIWNPFAHVSLESATVVLPAAAKVAPPAGQGDVLTIIYSGDGGWADLDRQLGGAFAAHGLPVLGVNSFKYYWRMRTVDESAAQLDALMTKYLTQWHKQRVWLVGFSFGADVLPSIIDKLSSENRARITQLVLLSPSRDLTFEIQFEGYMVARGRIKAFAKQLLEKFNKVPHYDTMPPVQALNNQFPVVCYYGEDDADDSLCTDKGLPTWVQVHAKKGNHHFDGGYQPLAEQMMDELPTKAAATGSAEQPATPAQ